MTASAVGAPITATVARALASADAAGDSCEDVATFTKVAERAARLAPAAALARGDGEWTGRRWRVLPQGVSG